MVVTIDKVRTGFCAYLDSEVIPKIKGKEKWLIGIGAPMVIEKKIKEFEPMLKEYGLIDSDGMIDIDNVESVVIGVATKYGCITEKIGNVDMTFNSSDVRKIIEMIKG